MSDATVPDTTPRMHAPAPTPTPQITPEGSAFVPPRNNVYEPPPEVINRNSVQYSSPVQDNTIPDSSRTIGSIMQDGRVLDQIRDVGVQMRQKGITFDTDEQIARFNMATVLAPRVGVSVMEAYKNYNAVSQKYFGMVAPPKTAWQSIGDEWKSASLSVRSAHVAAQLYATDWKSERFNDIFDQYLGILDKMPSFDETNRPLWVKGLKAAASFGPSILATGMAGITAGLIGTAVGQPVAGARVGTMLESTTLATGSIFGDILTTSVPMEDGTQVPLWEYMDKHMGEEEGNAAKRQAIQLARAGAGIGGVISGGIEMLQLDVLTGGKLLDDAVGHAANSILKELVTTQRLTKGASALVVAHAGNVAENTIQEFAQESVEWATAEMVTRTLERAQQIGLPERSVEQWANEMKKVAETAALGSFLIGLPGSVRTAGVSLRGEEPTGPGFRVPEGTKEIPTSDIVPHDIEVSEEEKIIVAEELATGTAPPLEVYLDDDGTYRPADRRTQAAFDGLSAFKLDTVPVIVSEKPDESVWADPVTEETTGDDINSDITVDDSEIDYNAEEIETATDEQILNTPEVAPTEGVDPSMSSAETAAQARETSTQRTAQVTKSWQQAKVKGALLKEWKRQALDTSGLTQSVINGVARIAQKIADYAGMDINQFLDEAFQPEAFTRVSALDSKGDVRGRVEFTGDRKAQIIFTDASDVSTLVHEFAHVMRGYLKDTDRTALEKHYNGNFWQDTGKKPTKAQVRVEEQFAEDFEKYLTEGIAPTEELKGVFARLAKLMRDIYGAIQSTITPEVRQLFDELLGKDPALAQMERDLQLAKADKDAALNEARERNRAEYEAMVAEMNAKYGEQIDAENGEDRASLDQSVNEWSKGIGKAIKKETHLSTDLVGLQILAARGDENAQEELAKIREERGLKPDKLNPVYKVASELSRDTEKSHGRDTRGMSEEDAEFLAARVAAETTYAIDNMDKNAIGWYDATLGQAMNEYSKIFPELKDDLGSQLVFKAALAITSQGNDVMGNGAYAVEAYNYFREHGKYPSKGWGESAGDIQGNFEAMNRIYDIFAGDWEGLQKFLTDYISVADLESFGFKVSGELKNTILPGSALLGPKIGAAFFSNMFGNYDLPTMDLWFTRTMTRHMGNITETIDPKKKEKAIKDAMKEVSELSPEDAEIYMKGVHRFDTGEMVTTFKKKHNFKKVSTDTDAYLAWADDTRKGVDRAGRILLADKVPDRFAKIKDSIRTTAKTTSGYATALQGDPKNGTVRNFYRDVINKAVKIMAENGYSGMTPADTQAAIWYYEKQLYESLGGVNKAAKPADYFDAAKEQTKNETNNLRRDATEALTGKRRSGDSEQGKRGDRQRNIKYDTRLTPPTDQRHPESVSGPYTRRDIQGSGNVLVTGDTIKAVAAYTANGDFSLFSSHVYSKLDSKTGKKTGSGEIPHAFFEFEGKEGANAYYNAINKAVEDNPDTGFMVDVKSIEDYSGGYRMFLTEDGGAGFAVNKENGDIVSVFKGKTGPAGASNMMIPLAIQVGGRRLDCYDTILPFLYGQFGFEDLARQTFDPKYIDQKTWKYDSPALTRYASDGKPDVLYMALPSSVNDRGFLGYENFKDTRAGRKTKRGTYNPKSKSGYIEDWKDGVTAQDEMIDQATGLNQTVHPARFAAPLPPDQYTSNLMKWNGDNKIVDEMGKPLPVYHASPVSISEFDPTRSNPSGAGGAGLYFSEAIEDVNENYASRKGPDIKYKIEDQERNLLTEMENYPENFTTDPDVLEMYKEWEDTTEAPEGKVAFWIQKNAGSVAGVVATRRVLGFRNIHQVFVKMENPYDEMNTEVDMNKEQSYDGTAMADYIGAMIDLGFEEEDSDTVWIAMREIEEDRMTGFDFKSAMEKSLGQLDPYVLDELFNSTSSREAFRRITQEVGFDGFIMYPQNYDWGEWTLAERHFILFEGGSNVKSSFNHGTFSSQNATSFDQSINHERLVQRAVRDGRPVADNVLRDYADRPWADKEIKRRKQLREDFSWLAPIVEQSETWEELKATILSEYAKEIPNEKPARDDFYKKAFNLISSPSQEKGNKEFISQMEDIQNLRQFIRDLSVGYDQLPGRGLHPTVLRAAKSGKISSPAQITTIQSLISRRPEVYRQAQALVNNDQSALENLTFERDTAILEADLGSRTEISQTNRINVAAGINDPEMRKLALQGEFTGSDAKKMAKKLWSQKQKLEEEIARATGDVAKAKEGTKRKEKVIENLREKEAQRIENNQLRRDLKRLRDYRLKLAKRIKRKIPGSVDLNAKELIEDIRQGLNPRFISEENQAKRLASLDALKRDPALKALMKPSELKAIAAKPLSDWSIDDLEEMDHKVSTLIQIGRAIKSQNDRERKSEIEKVAAGGIVDTLGQEPAEDITGVGSKEALAIKAGEKKNPLSAPWGKVVKGSFRPPRIFRMLFGENSQMYEWFVNKVNRATDESLKKTDDRVSKGTAKMEKLGITQKSLAQEIVVDGMTYTTDQVIHMYLGLKNDESRAAIIYGNKITQKQLDRFISQLTPAQKAWGDYLLSEFDGNYERLRQAYRKYKNEDLGNVTNYFPMKRLGVINETLDDEMQDMLKARNAWGSTYTDRGFTMSRVNIADEHQSAIQLGATSIWLSQVEKQEHFIASGQLVKDLHAIRNTKELRSAITQKHGEDFNKWIEKYVSDYASPNIYKALDGTSAMFAKLRGNYALGALAYNTLTMAKQIPSITLFLSRVGPAKLMASTAQLFNPGGFKKMEAFVDARDPQMKNRAMDRYLQELKKRSKDGKTKSWMRGISNFGMKPIQWIDKMVTVAGWMAVYNDHIARGFNEAQSVQAAQMAVLETQPSGRAKDLAELYRGNEAQNWFTMFSNQINQIWNLTAGDLPYALREQNYQQATGIVVGLMINFAVMTLASGWRVPEDDDEKAKAITYQFIRQMMNMVPLMGTVMYNATSDYGYSGVNPFPLGESIGALTAFTFSDDKSKEKFIKTFRYSMRDAGMFFGVPVVVLNRVWESAEEMTEGDYFDAVLQMFGPAFKRKIEEDE